MPERFDKNNTPQTKIEYPIARARQCKASGGQWKCSYPDGIHMECECVYAK